MESHQTPLNAHRFDPNREGTIKMKIEKYLWINKAQIQILDYYITTKGGITAWVKLDLRLTKEILRRASVAQNRHFRASIFVPKLARARKASIDKLLLGYKTTNDDFWYIIRNDATDLKVRVKRISAQNHVPYHSIDLDMLGKVSPLKQTRPIPENEEEESLEKTNSDGFSAPKINRWTLLRQKNVEKTEVYRRITEFLNRFDGSEKKKYINCNS